MTSTHEELDLKTTFIGLYIMWFAIYLIYIAFIEKPVGDMLITVLQIITVPAIAAFISIGTATFYFTAGQYIGEKALNLVKRDD